MQYDNPTTGALKLFDYLDTVSMDFMFGKWRGASYRTAHPLDGLLENYHWYGKRFVTVDEVYPLLFSRRNGGLVNVNPAFLKPFLPFVKKARAFNQATLGSFFQTLMPALNTRFSKAHLAMENCRGKLSATMIYDQLPIRDVFRRVDDNTVFAMMDYKGLDKPYFFFLKRTE